MRKATGLLWIGAMGLMLLWPLAAGATPLTPYFQVLPALPDGISADGSTIVGATGSSPNPIAFRWTEAEGLVPIGDGIGRATNTDGSVIVGTRHVGSGELEAIRWTAAEGIVGLGDLPGGSIYAQAYDVSADGSLAVGFGTTSTSPLREQAWYWTDATGLVSIGDLPGGEVRGVARAVSADGSLIVGDGSVDSSGHRHGFLWTQATGMVPIPLAPGGAGTVGVLGISADGSVVIGSDQFSVGTMGWRWTEAEGTVVLPDLPHGQVFSEPRDVSGDGHVIVGTGRTGTSQRAVYWLDGGPAQRLDLQLSAWGVDLGGVIPTNIEVVSDDGLVFAGRGTDGVGGATVGWVAGLPGFLALPEPGTMTLLGVGLALVLVSSRRAH